jgi:hypothetical protein
MPRVQNFGTDDGLQVLEAWMILHRLSDPIRGFLEALGIGDCRTLLRYCTPSATVVDPDTPTPSPVAQWCGRSVSSRPLEQRPISLQATPDGVLVTTATASPIGAAPPERLTELDWRFIMAGELIDAVEIGRREALPMPRPVAAALAAINRLDLDALMKAFAKDALLVDRGHEYASQRAIRRWANAEVIGVRAALKVVSAETAEETTMVTLHVDGDFDHDSLPEPFVLHVHFTVEQDQLVEVVIEGDGAP